MVESVINSLREVQLAMVSGLTSIGSLVRAGARNPRPRFVGDTTPLQNQKFIFWKAQRFSVVLTVKLFWDNSVHNSSLIVKLFWVESVVRGVLH